MNGKIGLEEHFAIEDTVSESLNVMPETVWPELRHRLVDIHETRLRLMDEHGMELMLLSLNAPTVQAVASVAGAGDMSRRANDFLAEQVARRPDRFQGLAALPMQDPEAATAELRRCVTELGFKGALVNGFSQAGNAETCRSFGPSGALSRTSTSRSTCTRATRWRPTRGSTPAIPGCSARPGRSARKPRCTRCA